MKTFIFKHQTENLVERIPANNKQEALKDLKENTIGWENFELIRVKGSTHTIELSTEEVEVILDTLPATWSKEGSHPKMIELKKKLRESL